MDSEAAARRARRPAARQKGPARARGKLIAALDGALALTRQSMHAPAPAPAPAQAKDGSGESAADLADLADPQVAQVAARGVGRASAPCTGGGGALVHPCTNDASLMLAIQRVRLILERSTEASGGAGAGCWEMR